MSATVANPTGSMQAENTNASAFLLLVEDLLNPVSRENALAELSKQREQVPDLAIILWNKFGTLGKLPPLPLHFSFS